MPSRNYTQATPKPAKRPQGQRNRPAPWVCCEKVFRNFPFAHRAHGHDGHCSGIHGHNWNFKLTFRARTVEPGTGFVVDFGKLDWLKTWLTDTFDHTLVLSADDPQLALLIHTLGARSSEAPQLASIVTVPSCTSEGLAMYVLERVNVMLPIDLVRRGVQCCAVEVIENENNSATALL